LAKPTKTAKTLMEKEEREKGAVNATVYKAYMNAGGGCCRFSMLMFWYVLHCFLTILNTAWVALWTADSRYERNTLYFYLGGLAVVALLLSVVSFIRTASMALVNIGASNRLHGGALNSVLHAPTSFFDVTPIGRIISRFSKDLHTMDNELGSYMDFFFWCALYVLSTMAVIVYATPYFAVALVPIAVIYIMTVNYFRSVNREAKRLESIARSPVYAHFSETLGGLTTIRAFDDAPRFVQTNMTLVDQAIRAFYVMKSSDRWLSVRLELIGAVIALCAALMAVVQVSGGGDVGWCGGGWGLDVVGVGWCWLLVWLVFVVVGVVGSVVVGCVVCAGVVVVVDIIRSVAVAGDCTNSVPLLLPPPLPSPHRPLWNTKRPP
jgi:ABC-type multidrug transport system fused ATPase/permease subunit